MLTVAVDGFEEVQITDCRVCGPPLVNVPVAMNCWLCPGVSKGLLGVTAIESKPAGVRVLG